MRYSRRFVPPLDVLVWYRETGSLDQAATDKAASVLSAEERAQYSRFRFARDARDYAAAHALLRTALSHGTDCRPEHWRFDKTPHGKPFLIGQSDELTSFSLSHSDGMVACAVANGIDVALGVDVECIDREVNVLEIARRFFSPVEALRLARLDPESQRRHFFDLWTLKESLVKAIGIGLATSLASLEFAIDHDGGVTLEAPAIGGEAWQFCLFTPGPKHRLAVAVRRPPSCAFQLSLQTVAPAG